MHPLLLSHGTTFMHRPAKTICVITTVSPISGSIGTFLESALHSPLRPPTDLIWTATSGTDLIATDVTAMCLTSIPLQRALATRSVAQVRCRCAGIRPHRRCSIATVSGKGEEPTTRPIRRHRSVGKVCTIPTEKEDTPPIENATRMNNGGGIGTDLATTTNVDCHCHRHRLHRGDHTRDHHSWIETGIDSTAREKETETCANEIATESGIVIWSDWHHRRQEGSGMTVTDEADSHSRHRFREWIQRGVLDLVVP